MAQITVDDLTNSAPHYTIQSLSNSIYPRENRSRGYMALKRRHRFLYLAIACIAGLAAIFIVDGYLGIYDTVYITIGEYEQKIEPVWWLWEENSWSSGARWGEKVSFRYEIENHQFSTYSTRIEASVWKENERVIDLFAEDKSIEPFGRVRVEWTLSSEELESAGFGIDEYADYTVKINYGDVERKIIVNFYSPGVVPYPESMPPWER